MTESDICLGPTSARQSACALFKEHGPLLSGEALWRALGYASADAFRQARSRGRVPVRTFKLEGRRAIYARTGDVSEWISKLGEETPT